MIAKKFIWWSVKDGKLVKQGLQTFVLEWRDDPNNWDRKYFWLSDGVIGVVDEEEYVLGKISVPCMNVRCSGPAWLYQIQARLWMMKCDKCGLTAPAHAKAKSMFFEYQVRYKDRNGEGPPLVVYQEREV